MRVLLFQPDGKSAHIALMRRRTGRDRCDAVAPHTAALIATFRCHAPRALPRVCRAFAAGVAVWHVGGRYDTPGWSPDGYRPLHTGARIATLRRAAPARGGAFADERRVVVGDKAARLSSSRWRVRHALERREIGALIRNRVELRRGITCPTAFLRGPGGAFRDGAARYTWPVCEPRQFASSGQLGVRDQLTLDRAGCRLCNESTGIRLYNCILARELREGRSCHRGDRHRGHARGTQRACRVHRDADVLDIETSAAGEQLPDAMPGAAEDDGTG